MNAQGKSLGKQLSIWMPYLSKLALDFPNRIWFMGRDMDVFYLALKETGHDVKYMTGLNRDNAKKLARHGKLEGWLKSIGVKNGDILIDSGYKGSIFSRIAESTQLDLYFLLLTTDPNGSCGYAVSSELNTEASRRIILALEHSPKREVVSWDNEKRRPIVKRLNGVEGNATNSFTIGCVSSLKESLKCPHKSIEIALAVRFNI